MPDKLLHILLVEDNPGDALLVQEMLMESDPESFTIHRAESLLDGLDKLAQIDADVILLDLSLPDSQGMETFTTMQSQAPRTPIVLLTGNDDDSMAIAAVEAGAQDYLVKDRLSGDSLVRALRYAVVRHQSRPEHDDAGEKQRGRVIGVIGSKGGVGTTTVACHLAAAIRGVTGDNVLLADLDLQSGGVGFLMQSKSPYSILDAASNIHRLDEGFWHELISKSADGVDVITSPALLGGEAPPASRLRHTLRFARKMYPWVIVDLGRLTPTSAGLVGEMSEIFLITTAELMAVHSAGRVRETLLNTGVVPEAIFVIHNEASKWSAGASVLKAVVPAPIRASLASCEDELAAACTKGRLLTGDHSFSKSIATLAAAVAGVDDPAERETGFSLRKLSLFGGRSNGQTQPSKQ